MIPLLKINIEQIPALIEFILVKRIACSSSQKWCWNHEAVKLYSLCIDHFMHILALKEKKRIKNRVGTCHLHWYTWKGKLLGCLYTVLNIHRQAGLKRRLNSCMIDAEAKCLVSTSLARGTGNTEVPKAAAWKRKTKTILILDRNLSLNWPQRHWLSSRSVLADVKHLAALQHDDSH